jgi:hypothetical protein
MINEPIWSEVLESIKIIEDKIYETEVFSSPVDVGRTELGPKKPYGSTDNKSYIEAPYNPGGSDRMMQRIPVMSKDHGPRTGKKSRDKKLDIKAIRASLAKRKDFQRKDGEKKVMNFDNFTKDDINTIKK